MAFSTVPKGNNNRTNQKPTENKDRYIIYIYTYLMEKSQQYWSSLFLFLYYVYYISTDYPQMMEQERSYLSFMSLILTARSELLSCQCHSNQFHMNCQIVVRRYYQWIYRVICNSMPTRDYVSVLNILSFWLEKQGWRKKEEVRVWNCIEIQL